MKFVKLENNIPVAIWDLEDIFKEYPDAEIYKDGIGLPHKELLANYNIAPLVTVPQNPGKYEILLEEGIPIFKDGEWHQTWTYREMTDEEKVEVDTVVDAKSLIVALMEEDI